MSLPIIVTHPSPLLHKGLRQLLVKSRFRPVRVATTLTQDLETYLVSRESAIWLTGIERSLAATNSLLRKIVSANRRVKAVIMAGSQKPEDIVAALKAGACGYVPQDIGGETLLKALELIAHGELIVHPQLVFSETADINGRASDHLDEDAAYLPRIRGQCPLCRLNHDWLLPTPNWRSLTTPAMSHRSLVVRCLFYVCSCREHRTRQSL